VRALVNNDAVKARLEIGGVNVRRLHSKKLLHTKMILIDNKKLVIGSHNFTQSAFTMNEEASVMLEMSSVDNDFVKYFTALWGL
jgi:phosphatidylserine/phosphatidylglycerophosphate/cardiolipin synthase-like enzyme